MEDISDTTCISCVACVCNCTQGHANVNRCCVCLYVDGPQMGPLHAQRDTSVTHGGSAGSAAIGGMVFRNGDVLNKTE